MNKKCIFTYITGNYDTLIPPKTITPGWDYICFTDNPKISSNVWDIRPLNKNDEKIECPKRRANSVVMKYYEYVSDDYDICIIIDGNMEISGNLNNFLEEFKFNVKETDLMIGQHPARDCIYEEAKEILNLKKDNKNDIHEHVKILNKKGYPKNNGLYETGVLVISRKSKTCISLFSEWYNTYNNLPSKRDQMSLNYTIWNNKDNINILECKRNERGSNPREKRPFNKYFNIKTIHK